MTLDRYCGMVVNFVQIAVLSRLLTPAEIGVSVIGVSVMAVSLAVREFASPGYLIQKPNITEDDKRTVATLTTLFGVVIAATCWCLAPLIEATYQMAGVAIYLRVCAVSLIIEGVNSTLLGLMRRELQFTRVMACNMTKLLVNVGLVCFLASRGFGFQSFGIGWICAISASTLLAFALKPEFTAFIPSLRAWRGLLSFGFYNGTAAVLSRAYDSIPLMLFGRTMGLPSTGVFYRALSICQLPDKMFLAGVLQVALPALSRAAQEGLDLKSAYLRGVQQITALYWPALAMMAILAHPIVDLLLGAQWKAVVPLLQIMAISWMFAFSNELSYGLLVSLGGVRDHLIRSAIIWPVSGALLVGASFWGPAAAAMALCVAVPFQWLVTFLVVRRRLTITFREMALALRPSAIVTGATAAAPLAAAYLLTNGGFEMSLAQAIALAGLSAAGWATAMIALKHPLWDELRLILTRVASILGLKPA